MPAGSRGVAIGLFNQLVAADSEHAGRNENDRRHGRCGSRPDMTNTSAGSFVPQDVHGFTRAHTLLVRCVNCLQVVEDAQPCLY
jgi:hypothetical protein